MEDLIADDAVVVTISHLGYIKRTSLSEFRTQGRGGVGSKGSTTRDEDFLEHLFVATNHNYLLIFTQKGPVLLDARLRYSGGHAPEQGPRDPEPGADRR
jgi:DNA gyrase/topoisomerase IV subunit A